MTEAGLYVGTELDLFANATNWKAYWSGRVRGFVSGDVLEVGAGLGANTLLLQTPGVRSWRCLEPDPALAERLRDRVRSLANCTVSCGTLAAIGGARFDSILYIDVLEHIADDTAELARAASLLNPGGNLIVLAPAHQALFSPFDAALGHHRRYSRSSLLACAPPADVCRLEELYYLDSVGMLTSFANRAALRQRQPTQSQIALWDRVIVPVSVLVDPLFRHRLGKSIVGVWRRVARAQ